MHFVKYMYLKVHLKFEVTFGMPTKRASFAGNSLSLSGSSDNDGIIYYGPPNSQDPAHTAIQNY